MYVKMYIHISYIPQNETFFSLTSVEELSFDQT
jgi:hypothetical protein